MNKIKKVLRFWYIYVLAIIASILGSVYYCHFINQPRNEETITLFIASYSSSADKLNNYLEDNSPSYLREINILMLNPKSSDFDYFMVNRGLNQADIFILPESYLFDSLIENQFASLSQDVLSNYFTYTAEDHNKGILIHDIGQADNDLMTFKSDKYEDEKYYLFFRINSLHIGQLNNGEYDTALLFTKALLSYE